MAWSQCDTPLVTLLKAWDMGQVNTNIVWLSNFLNEPMVPDFVYFTNVVELWDEGCFLFLFLFFFFFRVKMSKPTDKGNIV